MPNLTINLDHIAPGVNPDRVVAWVECSAPNGWSDGSTTITLPDAPVVFDNTGAATVELKATPTDVRYQVVVEYRKQGAGSRTTWRSGWFEFSANANLAALATVDIPGPPSTALSAFMATKGQPDGLATLDSGGKVPMSQMAVELMTFEGTWDASTNTPTLADGVGDKGEVYIVSVAGTQDLGSGSVDWAVGDWLTYDGARWERVRGSDAILAAQTAAENAQAAAENARNAAQAAQGDAETARDEAEDARDIALQAAADAVDISNITVDDDIVEALIKNTGGAGPKTRSAVLGSIAGTRDLISQYTAPGQLIVGHRGGYLYPEHSLEGYRALAASGYSPEIDLSRLSDGTLVPHHDTTLDRTTTGTGPIASITRAEWKALRLKAPVPGQQQAVPPTFDEVLTDLGGRTLLSVELRAGLVDEAIDKIVARGLQRAVLANSFDLSHVQAAAAAGIPAAYITDTHSDFASLLADGIEYLCVNIFAANRATYIAAAEAAGMKVLVYNISYADQVSGALAEGAFGVVTGDPWGATGEYATSDVDPFYNRIPWPNYKTTQNGTLVASTTHLGFANRGQYGRILRANGADVATASMDWAGVRPNLRMTFEGTLRFLPNASEQTRWAGIAIGTWPRSQGTFIDATKAGQSAYHFMIRRNGVLGLYRFNDNVVADALGAISPPADPIAGVNEAGEARIRIQITDTHIYLFNLTNGTSVNVADSGISRSVTPRLAATWAGTDAVWEDITIRNS